MYRNITVIYNVKHFYCVLIKQETFNNIKKKSYRLQTFDGWTLKKLP